MRKIVLCLFIATLSLSAMAQKKDTIKTETLKEVTIFASIKESPNEEPAALSTVDAQSIEKRISNQEFPEVLKNTPSAYATKQGGGFGDSRITLRGFGTENIALLINGIPVNGAENGKVYWSNWAGLGDVTRIIQVQRGIGLSKLGLYSVGGTINIVTRPTSTEPYANIYFGVGNDNYNKMMISFSSGENSKGWATNFMLSKAEGDGFVRGTNFQVWNYLLNVSKKINNNHMLLFTAFGANQWHNMRNNKQTIATYDKYGIRYNADFGYLNGEPMGGNNSYNEYHKPQISLSHFWTINEKSSLKTVLYGSIAQGGGRTLLGNYLDAYKTPEGLIDYNSLMYEQMNNDTAKSAYGMSTNSHNWFGLISTYSYNFSDALTLTAGVDARYYKGLHYKEITDLLGGKFFLPKASNYLAYQTPGSHLRVGDRTEYDYISYINQIGVFAQLQYKVGRHNAFVSLTGSDYMFQRKDMGKYGQYGFSVDSMVTKVSTFFPIGIKAGYNFDITEHQRVFVNGGYVTRAPNFDSYYVNRTNNMVKEPTNEKITTVEAGYGIFGRNFNIQLNAYYTIWKDKCFTKFSGTTGASILGINALHKGVELEFSYKPIDVLTLSGNVSIGEWQWTNNVEDAHVFDNNGTILSTVNIYSRGLHVGGAPQSSLSISADWQVFKNLSIGADFNYYDRYYADFYVDGRTTEADKDNDSWRMPSFYTIDLNANYEFKLTDKTSIDVFGNVNNLLNEKYIADAQDGAKHDEATAKVFYGYGTTWTVGVRFNF
ncbi:MAG: TonB-dependent receptor plug domain-containing protein [Bacteroidales bacterium]|jgi:outer membrane cobalamin receptor|nr:TonB-dependent receptor plug domain-containing protein [Bacteroidales bacterium]